MGVDTDKKLSINPIFFQEVKEDREGLGLILSRMKELTGNAERLVDNQPEFVELLGNLRDQLAFHFALEEAYGYFEEALDVAPRLHRESQRLLSQHAELYDLAQKLADAADERPLLNVEALAKKVEDLVFKFENHEAAEVTLILSALQDDIGDGD